MPEITGSEWEMIMRSPEGDEYAIASGNLPVTMLPDPADDGTYIGTLELASLIRSIADQVEALHIDGQIPDATFSHDADDLY